MEVVLAAYNLACEEIETLKAQLRAITEAEPVEWQWRDAAKGSLPASKWFNDLEPYCKLRANDSRYETRALAVVAPKEDTEE